MGDYHPSTGVPAWKAPKPDYVAYKSPYGPKYKIQPNVAGWTLKSATKVGLTLAGFGSAAGILAFYFLADIPRFRKDVIERIPILREHYHKEIPASDNPF